MVNNVSVSTVYKTITINNINSTVWDDIRFISTFANKKVYALVNEALIDLRLKYMKKYPFIQGSLNFRNAHGQQV